MSTVAYEIVDVFTDRPFAGNPLAVVFGAESLAGDQMQTLAREFNLSETVFVLPAENAAHAARVRIFTPGQELPFAGHPTVGTAVCLARERLSGHAGGQDAVIVLEELVGPVRCAVRLDEAGGFAEFDCPKLPERQAEGGGREFIAAALGLSPAEIGFENHAPSVWSAGVPYHFVPVRNMHVLAKALAAPSAWPPAFGVGAAFLYTRETEGHDHAFRARMFAPEIGISEDPATGSAAAALAGVVHEFDALPDGDHAAIIEQGFEMGRPSLIRLETSVAGGRIVAVRVGGAVVQVASGILSSSPSA
jgi:trans-2,3-dihydro-3-hydroxyanthranilate isomerase